MTQTVVITGASAGIARATARLYGARGASVGLIARGQAGLDGAAQDVIEAGGQALAVPTDVADHAQVEKAATEIEAQFGPIDVWINVAFASVFAPFAEITPDEFRRVTEVSYLGFVHGTMAALSRMRPRGRGHDRAGRLRAQRARHPAAVGLLRGQARDQRVHRVAALRTAARGVERARDRGADAGGEHAAVLLGAVPAAPAPAAGAADLPARGGRARRAVRRRPPGAQAVLGGRQHGRHAAGAEGRPGAARPVPGQDRVRLAADQRRRCPRAAGRTTCSTRWTGQAAATTVRTAPSTTSRISEVRSCGCRIIRR